MTFLLTDLLLAVTVNGRWQPGIGDPTVMGWLIAVGYGVASLLCALAAMREVRLENPARTRCLRTAFWGGLACTTLFLAFNKQLDLQTLLTQTGRDLARAQGWYEDRREVQRYFIWGVALLGALAFLMASVAAFRAPRRFHFALAGIAFLLCFILIRATSLHHVDVFLGMRLGQVKLHWILECGGIFVVGAAACVGEQQKSRDGGKIESNGP